MPIQFGVPEEVIEQVKIGELGPEAYSPYMEAIHNKHVIAVNMSYQIGKWIDALFYGDQSFWNRAKHDLARFDRMKVTCADRPTNRPGIKFLRRVRRKFGLSGDPSTVCWNNNSGGSAINFAIHTGVKRIFLLGFDMRNSQFGSHWHGLYGRSKSPPYPTHLRGFPVIAEDAKSIGVEIINVNLNSAITCFPRVPLSEVL